MTHKTSHTSQLQAQIKAKNKGNYEQNKHTTWKPIKLVISVVSGPGIKELEYTTH